MTKEGVNEMDPKPVYRSFDSQRSVHLHRVDKVRWSRRVCKRHRKCWKFQSKFYHFTAIQTSVTISVKQHEHDRVIRCTFFCWFQRNKDHIKIVARQVRHVFTTAAERPWQRRDWKASVIWNREFSNTNSKILFPRCMTYQTGTYEMTHKSAQS